MKGLRAALRQRTQQASQFEAETLQLKQREGQARAQLAEQLATLTGEPFFLSRECQKKNEEASESKSGDTSSECPGSSAN